MIESVRVSSVRQRSNIIKLSMQIQDETFNDQSGRLALMTLRLHSLISLLKKSGPPFHEDATTSSPMPLQPAMHVEERPLLPAVPLLLPVELWQEIALMIGDKCDLIRLCQTSQMLHSICEPYLYRSLKIDTDKSKIRRIEGLLHTIQTRHLEDAIEYLHVNHPDYPPSSQTREECRQVDELLGKLMVPLPNLRQLIFRCDVPCHTNWGINHPYLKKLETRRLTSLLLDCKCLNQPHSGRFKILSSPGMQGIVSIDLGDSLRRELDFNEESFIEGNPFLPCLKEITSHSFKPFGPHFRGGSIASICNHKSHSDLATVLLNCPPGLMHLHHDRLQTFIPAIIKGPTPYLKLRTMIGFIFHEVADVSTKPSDHAHS